MKDTKGNTKREQKKENSLSVCEKRKKEAWCLNHLQNST